MKKDEDRGEIYYYILYSMQFYTLKITNNCTLMYYVYINTQFSRNSLKKDLS